MASAEKNYQVVFAKRPGVNGIPAKDNFKMEECAFPTLSADSPGDVSKIIVFFNFLCLCL